MTEEGWTERREKERKKERKKGRVKVRVKKVAVAWQYRPQCVVQFGSASKAGVAVAIDVAGAEHFVQDEWI